MKICQLTCTKHICLNDVFYKFDLKYFMSSSVTNCIAANIFGLFVKVTSLQKLFEKLQNIPKTVKYMVH